MPRKRFNFLFCKRLHNGKHFTIWFQTMLQVGLGFFIDLHPPMADVRYKYLIQINVLFIQFGIFGKAGLSESDKLNKHILKIIHGKSNSPR